MITKFNLFESTKILFDNNSMIIGVIHNKKITISKDKIDDVRKCAKYGIYFEGSEPEKSILDFLEEYDLSNELKSWESNENYSDEATLLLDLFGGDCDVLIDQIKPETDKPLIDYLVKNKSKWTMVNPTKKDILELSSYVDDEILLNPYNKEKFKRFHKKAKNIVFNEDGKHSDNYLCKLQYKANNNRDKELMKKYKKGGLFFAGESHLDKKYNTEL